MSKFIREESGATMVEYGLLIALIALVAVIGLALFGSAVLNLFDKASDEADALK